MWASCCLAIAAGRGQHQWTSHCFLRWSNQVIKNISSLKKDTLHTVIIRDGLNTELEDKKEQIRIGLITDQLQWKKAEKPLIGHCGGNVIRRDAPTCLYEVGPCRWHTRMFGNGASVMTEGVWAVLMELWNKECAPGPRERCRAGYSLTVVGFSGLWGVWSAQTLGCQLGDTTGTTRSQQTLGGG